MNDSSGRHRARRNREDIQRRQLDASFRLGDFQDADADSLSVGSSSSWDGNGSNGNIPRLKPSRADSTRN